MKRVGSTLQVFVSLDDKRQECILPRSNVHFPRLSFELYDQVALMQEFHFRNETIQAVQRWLPTVFESSRRADIFRLLLAHKYGLAYLDLDVVLITSDAAPFKFPFVAVAVFDKENALSPPLFEHVQRQQRADGAYRGRYNLEFSNSAFCLAPAAIEQLVEYQMNRIAYHAQSLHASLTWDYVELGPSAFRRVLLNSHHRFVLLSQNSPNDFKASSIISQVERHGHLLLHLTGGNKVKIQNNYVSFVGEVLAGLDAKAAYNKMRLVRSLEPFMSCGGSSSSSSSNSQIDPLSSLLTTKSSSISTTPATSNAACSGFFTMVEIVLGGAMAMHRGDCCDEMRSEYFRDMLYTLAGQASSLGSTVAIFASSDQSSACGKCLVDLFRELADPGSAKASIPVFGTAADVGESEMTAERIIKQAVSSATLHVQTYNRQRLLSECGLTRSMIKQLMLAAAGIDMYQENTYNTSSPIYDSEEGLKWSRQNNLAVEMIEALSILCAAKLSHLTFIAPNVLLLTMEPHDLYTGSEFVAMHSKNNLKWGSNAVVSSHLFCLSPPVLANAVAALVGYLDMYASTSSYTILAPHSLSTHESLVSLALQASMLNRNASMSIRLVSVSDPRVLRFTKALDDQQAHKHVGIIVTPGMVEFAVDAEINVLASKKLAQLMLQEEVENAKKRSRFVYKSKKKNQQLLQAQLGPPVEGSFRGVVDYLLETKKKMEGARRRHR